MVKLIEFFNASALLIPPTPSLPHPARHQVNAWSDESKRTKR